MKGERGWTTAADISWRASLPARYHSNWRDPFDAAIQRKLSDGSVVLDVGSGRHPAIPPQDRSDNVEYVGLDLSRAELDAAGEEAYTTAVVGDVAERDDTLIGRFDLVVSWQVFEHVADLEAALRNLHAYLKTDGVLVALFSGRWAAYAVINRLIPDTIGERIVDRVMQREASNQPVFPACYDKCYDSALRELLEPWPEATITPLFRGAQYFQFSAWLTRMYLMYEDRAERHKWANLATHYLVVARAGASQPSV